VRQSLLVLIPVAGLLIGSATPVATPARAQTSASPAPERRCFSEQQIQNFRATSAGTLYLKVWGSNPGTYQLSTSGGCLDLNTAHQVAIRPAMGSSRLCTGDWATVAAPGVSGPLQTCRALINKRLTDAEIAALPARDRP
jgi:hypothetical protein